MPSESESESEKMPLLDREVFDLQAFDMRHCKRRGEAAEAAFLAKASGLGFGVAKPWGESDPYDFILNAGHGFLRVQVKSASAYSRSQYVIRGSGDRTLYTKEIIDFLVAYIVPEDLWYVLPVEAFAPRVGLHFNPHGRGTSMFEKFLDAWCLMAFVPRNSRELCLPKRPRRCHAEQLPIRCALCPLRQAG